MKKALTVIVLAALAIGGWFYFSRPENGKATWQTTPVARGDLTQAVTATGTLNPVLNVQVGSQISGNIQKLLVDFNSPVKAGQIIAELDSAIYRAAVHQAEGELSSAQAALELARLNESRQRELAAKKINTQSELDTAVAALHQAESTVSIKQAQLERANVDLNRCTITAPIDGIVISRAVDVGQTVAASLQAPIIFTIANDLRKMQIDANVAEADVGNVAVGQEVEFTVDAFPYLPFRGKVAQVRNAPITVQNVVTYDTVIEVSNAESKLKPGMTANVSISIAQRQNALKIPNAALRFRPPDSAKTGTPAKAGGGGEKRKGRDAAAPSPTRTVYVLRGDQAEPVQVKLGISDGISTEALEGLSENDLLITGMVTPQPASPAQPSTNPLGGGGGRRF